MKRIVFFLTLLVIASMVLTACGGVNSQATIADRVDQVIVKLAPSSQEDFCDDVKLFMEQRGGDVLLTMSGASGLGYVGEVKDLESLGVKIVFVDGSKLKVKVKQGSNCMSQTVLTGFSLEDVDRIESNEKEDYLGTAGTMSSWFIIESFQRE